jgi:hypothetical protein
LKRKKINLNPTMIKRKKRRTVQTKSRERRDLENVLVKPETNQRKKTFPKERA